MAIGMTNAGGGASKTKAPRYTYTGQSILQTDSGGWRIRFLTSGTLTITKRLEIDIHCVGGGGGGSVGVEEAVASGGGGGYTHFEKNVIVEPGSYSVTIGAGGAAVTGPQYSNLQPVAGNSGGVSSFGTLCAANGGQGGQVVSGYGTQTGGRGGSGGGGANRQSGENATDGGSNGSTPTYSNGGQGTNTYDFGDTSDSSLWELRSGGGGGYVAGTYKNGGSGGGGKAGVPGTNGTANYGGGGGGTAYYASYCLGSSGGSGIVIIRNARS